MVQGTGEEIMPSREENKHQRRLDILNAARTLMGDAGDAGFSMRALADAAGVSIATPYNLFGSKQAILIAMLDLDLADYQAALAQLKADGTDVMFEAITLVVRLFDDEPDFYRNVLAAVALNGGPELRHMINGPRYVLWKKLLKQATDAGALRDDVDADAFTITLRQIIGSNIQEWALGNLSLEEMDARSRYGVALLLTGIATDVSRESVEARRRQAEADLQRLWRAKLRSRIENGQLDAETEEVFADQLAHVDTPKPARKSRRERVA